MIRVLLLLGNGSDLLVLYLTGQMEIDLLTADNLESAQLLSLKKPVDLILAPVPEGDGYDLSYSSALIRWHQKIRSGGISTAFLTYAPIEKSIILTDVSAGITSIEQGPSSIRSIITVLRQAANKNLLERSFRNEYEIQRKIITKMPLPCLQAESGIISGTNPAMEALSGYRTEDLVGKCVSDIIISGERPDPSWYYAELLDSTGREIPVRIYGEEGPEEIGSSCNLLFIEDRRE
ncbi:MAG: hypothetical protein CVV33_01320, partial [Methanomicrobiales archaeon HGW-Methanomicrobiales-4]